MSRLTFDWKTDGDGKLWADVVNEDKEVLGTIEKVQVGQWASWCLCVGEVYFSAGCQDEIRECCRKLNANKVKSRCC